MQGTDSVQLLQQIAGLQSNLSLSFEGFYTTILKKANFSESTHHKLTLIFENTQMIEDQRRTLTSLTSHLFVRHLAHIISSLDYLSTLISFTKDPFFSKVFLFKHYRGLVAFPYVKFGNDVTGKNLNRKQIFQKAEQILIWLLVDSFGERRCS